MSNKILVSLKDLESGYRCNNKKWLRIAVERKIVPLKASPRLAQMCDHLIGDGSLHLTKCGGGHIRFYGKRPKLQEIAKLYRSISNKKIKLIDRNNGHQDYTIDEADTILAKCLYKIGVPAGDKVLTKFEVPFWILYGSKEVKRKFVQALFDDELEGLYKNKKRPNSWTGLRLKMNKSEKLVSSALKFFNQIISILKEFSIETTNAKVYNNVSYIRPNGTKTYSVTFRVRNNIENRKRFFKEIGFIYSKRKQQKLIESLA